MANVKISALPAVTTVVPGTDVLPLVSGGVTTKATPNSIINASLAAQTSLSLYGGTWTLANSTTISAASTKTLTLNGGAGSNGLVLDASNNVGIGTSSPGAKLDVQKADNVWVRINNTQYSAGHAQAGIQLWGNSTYRSALYYDDAVGTTYLSTTVGTGQTLTLDYGSTLTFNKSGSEVMRLDSSGNLLVGTTNGGSSYPSARVHLSTDSGTTNWCVGPYSTATNFMVSNGSGGVQLVGAATSWSAISDERYKTDIRPIVNAVEKVTSLRAVTGRFKTDTEGFSRAFLIAQDMLVAFPEAVDAEDPEKLSARYTDTIPLLVAAIKELSAEIEILKAKVN